MAEITFEEWAELLHTCNMAELEGGSGGYNVLDKLRAHFALPPLHRGMLSPVNAWELAHEDESRVLATCARGHEHVMNDSMSLPQAEGAVAILDECPCDAPLDRTSSRRNGTSMPNSLWPVLEAGASPAGRAA
jgi:hypothetical protein